MNWLVNTLKSSIGKKLMMAVTGLCFCSFLILHLAGNLILYSGRDAFNSYAEKLHSLGSIITMAEFGLLFFAIIHILIGATLFYQNLKARPIRYSINKWAGGRSIGSVTMPYTGLFLLIFVIIHLLNFHFIEKNDTTIFQIVTDAFAKPGYIAMYVAAMIVVAIHVSHGFWSAFQTIGANHPKYMPVIRGLSIVFSIALGVGFGFIPIYFSFIA
ncbi:MAG: succinate dehydrogenase cytochrome b subunit [Deltaproteobacteria bacterium]|nr:succinate dehydrogenase cytochrome b subunit [Deltaproteobacteria bacterium]